MSKNYFHKTLAWKTAGKLGPQCILVTSLFSPSSKKEKKSPDTGRMTQHRAGRDTPLGREQRSLLPFQVTASLFRLRLVIL